MRKKREKERKKKPRRASVFPTSWGLDRNREKGKRDFIPYSGGGEGERNTNSWNTEKDLRGEKKRHPAFFLRMQQGKERKGPIGYPTYFIGLHVKRRKGFKKNFLLLAALFLGRRAGEGKKKSFPSGKAVGQRRKAKGRPKAHEGGERVSRPRLIQQQDLKKNKREKTTPLSL